jgi:uncharacterized protein
MDLKFGLKEKDINSINTVFAKYPNIKKVIIYGSRAKGNYKNGSDIDLTIIGNNIDNSVLNKIQNDIDELMLPYSFDLSSYETITSKELLEHIERVGIIFYQK